MLFTETPFPNQGSYALYIDLDQPAPQDSELVRILNHRGDQVVVSFPLRRGASGNKVVALADLIDPTPLDQAERKELAELARELHGRIPRSPRLRQMAARHEQLRQRTIWSVYIKQPLARARALAEQTRRAA